MSQTACLVLGLAWALSAVAEPAYLRLEGVAADSEWIGWNEQGAYHLELPAEWELTAESGRRVVIRLAEGRTVELPEDTSLSAVGVARPTVQAGFVRGRHRGRGVTL
ncbi:MAG: hypothetical protein HUU35_04170, partial [Armatimonadetes bacterium]|nr:hypothetical protein [Armatimonadota bacterium]